MIEETVVPHQILRQNSLRNQQLFSSAYLRDLENALESAQVPLDDFQSTRQTIGEWRAEYHDFSRDAHQTDFIKQSLSALGVAYAPREDGFTLFADSDKEHATGLCFCIDDDDLGRAVKGRHYQVQLVRELRSANLGWGVLTNGARWRLCHAQSAAPYEEWLEVDLDSLLKESAVAPFGVFTRLFGNQAWRKISREASNNRIGLDERLTESQKRTEAVERHLKSRVETILARLCLGFVADETATNESAANSTDESTIGYSNEYSMEKLDEIYRNATYLLYRILFVFYAEARGLLPVENPSYAPFSLREIVALAFERQQNGVRDDDSFSLWKKLTRLFFAVDEGDDEMGVTAYNGGLFSDTEKPYLKNHKIGDEFLAPALFDLAHEALRNGPCAIDYRDLSVRHLGTLYEGLLEYKLNLVTGEPVVVRDHKGKRQYISQSAAGDVKRGETILERGEVYFADDKGERKASGSYYTPEDVVQYIVANTVLPKLRERRAGLETLLDNVQRERAVAATPEERARLERYADGQIVACVENEILRLRLLDPAMGSGHFLVAAGQMLTDFIVETFELAPWRNDDISTEPMKWKRRVVERCLYGVDKNPLAQELAKLSLWIASARAGEPLTFLDLHLKIGNSLLGTPLHRLNNLPEPKKKNTAAPPANRDLFATLREETLGALLREMARITNRDSHTIDDVKQKGQAHLRAQLRAERWNDIANVWLASLWGLRGEDGALRDDEWQRLLNHLTLDYAPEQWQLVRENSVVLREAREIAARESFFHWELEFPESVQDGACRFDCVIANPPYVGTKADAAINALYDTAPCGDLYAWLFEKSLRVLDVCGNLGTIVPLSLMFSRNFKTLRTAILGRKGTARFANFDNNPDAIFEAAGAPRNRQRATISLFENSMRADAKTYSTRLHFWTRADRPLLFENLNYVDVSEFADENGFPRFGDPKLVAFRRQSRRYGNTIEQELERNGSLEPPPYRLYVGGVAGYFLTAMPTALKETGLNLLRFDSEWTRDVAFVTLNSNVFFWHWCAFGDGFHVTVETIISMILPQVPVDDAETIRLRDRVLDAAESCATYQMKWGEQIPNYNFNKRMDILLKIDDWIVKHVAPDLNLPRDIFAQYKSNSFLRPLDLSALTNDSIVEKSE